MTTETEFTIYDSKGSYPKVIPALYTHNRQILKAEGEFAKAMIQSGMVAGLHEKHGDDEIMRLLPPAEVIERACTLAELAYAEFAKRGWILPLPSIEEMREEIRGHSEAVSDVGFTRQRTGPNGKAPPPANS